jgi:N-sulfoglucosamine sulfohydrolase
VVKANTVDDTHFISGIDFFPTVLEAAGISVPKGLDGFSFLPLLKGERQAGREKVFTQIDMKAGGDAVPMRCVQDARFGYIFSPWADGTFWYRNNNEGLTMRAMVEAAENSPEVAERVRMFRYRAMEELYDLQRDPDCLDNLVGKAAYAEELERRRGEMRAWMKETGDPLLAAFEVRGEPEKVKAALVAVYGANYTRAAERRPRARRGRRRN